MVVPQEAEGRVTKLIDIRAISTIVPCVLDNFIYGFTFVSKTDVFTFGICTIDPPPGVLYSGPWQPAHVGFEDILFQNMMCFGKQPLFSPGARRQAAL
jgi:hypothetical protein